MSIVMVQIILCKWTKINSLFLPLQSYPIIKSQWPIWCSFIANANICKYVCTLFKGLFTCPNSTRPGFTFSSSQPSVLCQLPWLLLKDTYESKFKKLPWQLVLLFNFCSQELFSISLTQIIVLQPESFLSGSVYGVDGEQLVTLSGAISTYIEDLKTEILVGNIKTWNTKFNNKKRHWKQLKFLSFFF